mgnify:CR=1 FL=1
MVTCRQTTQRQPKNSCKPADFRQFLQFTCAHSHTEGDRCPCSLRSVTVTQWMKSRSKLLKYIVSRSISFSLDSWSACGTQGHSSNWQSTQDGPCMDLLQVHYQTCFKNLWPSVMSSGAKEIFNSTLPHNCVWAHSMQHISFTTHSFQMYSLEIYFLICTLLNWASKVLVLRLTRRQKVKSVNRKIKFIVLI